MQSLKDQLASSTQEHAQDTALLRILVEDSDQTATLLLAKLRMNHNEGTTFKTLRRGSDAFPLQIPALIDGQSLQYAYDASEPLSASSSTSSNQFQCNSQMLPSTMAESHDSNANFSLSLPECRLRRSTVDFADYPSLKYSQHMDGAGNTPMEAQAHGWLAH
ncbi:hypothetical protein B0A48_18599 [Cryoendolithus antarcticus]|uniref:Uncharacterized protein n=1 Tax=Cryoendolithus antarcticus TaxID=1507870 RepID=A0A1V8S8L2_9PEZI|nr:hypothetical protein B0A48_18599 [Cryoendolithus antarcticus]